MAISPRPYIVLIDDDVHPDQPLVGYIQQEYGKDNVFLFQHPKDGIGFITNNLSKRIIVLLDIMFYGQKIGFEIFNEIIERSSLVCFIIMSGNIEQASWQNFADLINKHAFYLIQRDKTAKEILRLLKQAEDHLAVQVDSALEEWILRQKPEDQQKVFITSRSGKSYTLLDILRAVRTGDDSIGRQMVISILTTAIDILKRDKSKIG